MINFHKGVAPLRTNLNTAILCHIYDIPWIKMSIYILSWFSPRWSFPLELDICDICNPPCYSSIKIFNVDGFVVCTSYLSLFLHTDFPHTDFSPHKFRTKTAQISIKCHKLFKFFTEIWNFFTWQIFFHKYNLRYCIFSSIWCSKSLFLGTTSAT